MPNIHDWSADEFTKSSFSPQSSNECVEVAKRPGFVALRDSKQPFGSPILEFNDAEWAAFKLGMANDEF